MFYKVKVNDHIRVPPKIFDLKTEEAVIQRIKKKYDGFISKDLGIVIDVAGVNDIREGLIIAGDGAAYFDTTFELLAFRPELQEVIAGNIRDIADFGAFISMGPIEGMIHVSQTMDDFVSFSKDKVLSGKESKQTLKVGDRCIARIVAVSYKDLSNPKIGLTMRQDLLGKSEWIEARQNKEGDKVKKEVKKK
ncbi:DNA-directed RNA polymerase [Candidatus Woesearchaeota archaeon]|jgi:DNA-directed RNA polymerase subunit E'|nr:DNA-directed RNA polymerase [Candidatus Woesearchaeota archaeon]